MAGDDDGGQQDGDSIKWWIGCLMCQVPLRIHISRERVRLVCPNCGRSKDYSALPPLEEEELPPFVKAHYN